MRRAGRHDRLVTFERPQMTEDDLGTQIPGEPAVLQQAWAKITFGTGQEKREAAQEGGSQVATFEVLPSAVLRDVKLTDHIRYDGSEWNIINSELLDRQTLRFTAVRSR